MVWIKGQPWFRRCLVLNVFSVSSEELWALTFIHTCFSDCRKISSDILVFKNVGKRSAGKTYRSAALLVLMLCLWNTCNLFRSTADLLTLVPDKIAMDFIRSGTTQAVALDIPEHFVRCWHVGLLHKLKSYRISGRVFSLISTFFSKRRLRVVLDGTSSLEYPVNVGDPQLSILGPTLFLLYMNDPPAYVIW